MITERILSVSQSRTSIRWDYSRPGKRLSKRHYEGITRNNGLDRVRAMDANRPVQQSDVSAKRIDTKTADALDRMVDAGIVTIGTNAPPPPQKLKNVCFYTGD